MRNAKGDVETITLSCPNESCEKDFEMPVKEIHKAAVFAASHGTPIAISCPNCCHVAILSSEAPKNPDDLQEWINTSVDDEDWLPCLPLSVQLTREPNGYIEEAGDILYTPGDGAKGLPRREYMMAFGFDPLCWLTQHGRAPK